MKRLVPGAIAPPIDLPTAGAGRFDSRALLGRNWLLSFHRYAT